MIHRWSVLCGRSVVDSTTNQISLFDVIEKIEADVEVDSLDKLKNEGKGVLVVPINFEMVSYISDINSDADKIIEMKLVLLDPNGQQLQESLSKFDISKQKVRNMRIRMGVQGIPAKEKGFHLFQVWLKQTGAKEFERVAEIPLEVDIRVKEKK